MAKKPKTEAAEAEVEDVPTPLTVFTPPHPMAVFRVLKQAFRAYHGGAGAVLTVTTPPDHLASAVTTVAGTLEVDKKVMVMPPSVRVSLTQGGTVKATRDAPVGTGNPAAYTTTFPGAVLVAGTATATVRSTVPAKTATTPAFTLT